ncbi:hypothetical protein H0O03_01880 [Candidatus Micrarchaeota archaeon]|nr:hypothetical protein [Candidatus Micrarchaeota archaeon]
MENKAAALFCLVAAFAGIAALALAAKSLEPVPTKISDLSEENAGSRVLVSGTITSASWKNGNLFLSVCDSACVKVIVFSSLAQQMRQHSLDPAKLSGGKFISVEGTLEEYMGELEIKPFYYNSIDVVA